MAINNNKCCSRNISETGQCGEVSLDAIRAELIFLLTDAHANQFQAVPLIAFICISSPNMHFVSERLVGTVSGSHVTR